MLAHHRQTAGDIPCWAERCQTASGMFQNAVNRLQSKSASLVMPASNTLQADDSVFSYYYCCCCRLQVPQVTSAMLVFSIVQHTAASLRYPDSKVSTASTITPPAPCQSCWVLASYCCCCCLIQPPLLPLPLLLCARPVCLPVQQAGCRMPGSP